MEKNWARKMHNLQNFLLLNATEHQLDSVTLEFRKLKDQLERSLVHYRLQLKAAGIPGAYLQRMEQRAEHMRCLLGGRTELFDVNNYCPDGRDPTAHQALQSVVGYHRFQSYGHAFQALYRKHRDLTPPPALNLKGGLDEDQLQLVKRYVVCFNWKQKFVPCLCIVQDRK